MIKSITQVELLTKELSDIKKTVTNLAYRIIKNLDNSTDLYLYAATTDLSVYESQLLTASKSDTDFFPTVFITIISENDYQEELNYYKAFLGNNLAKNADNSRCIEGATYRFSNIDGKYPPLSIKDVAPIISFYSYKGGVGRTTTLAAFASYHARRTNAKVFMIDCDFEAPGFANFFGLDQQKIAEKGGVVEFLSDTSNLFDETLLDKDFMDNYVHEISKSSAGAVSGYAGDGSIQIMTAGNLSETTITEGFNTSENAGTHIDHYIQGLARLDFANTEFITKRFELLLKAIQKNYNPDVILIDSRTGFNDIFNNISLRLSDVLVGFFGTSIQNLPGIHNFMNTVQRLLPDIENETEDTNNNTDGDEDKTEATNTKAIDIFMVAAMSSYSPPQTLRDFKKIITSHPAYDDKLNNVINAYAINYHPQLAVIGTPQDSEGDALLYFTDPKTTQYPSYSNGGGGYLFEEISKKILEKKKIITEIEIETESNIPTNPPVIRHERVTKEDILTPIQAFLAEHDYADNFELNNEFIDNFFYFRNYLSDLFIKDTFIVRGYKGTGKTLLYKALQNTDFVEKLKHIYSIKENFDFCAVIDKVVDTREEQNLILENKLSTFSGKYTRFWKVYIWNVLAKKINYTTQIATFEVVFSLGATTWTNFETRMSNDNMLIIENELLAMNTLLKSEKRKIILTFDYLDNFWSPNRWKDTDNPITALFDFCNANHFSHIYFKIFVRTDLYNILSTTTNKNAFEKRTIPLEWDKEDLFAYFFKIVFSRTDHKFKNWLYSHSDNKDFIKEIEEHLLTNNNQISTKRADILEFLVDIFFGKYFNLDYPYYGLSYDWFHKNLKNATDLISIRPFNALVGESIKFFLYKRYNKISTTGSILTGKYYGDKEVRSVAGKTSFNDVASQKGYKYLSDFARVVIEDHSTITPFLYTTLSEYDLKKLLEEVDKIINTTHITPFDDVKTMLIETGILRQSYRPNAGNRYTFAFLYKDYLKLKKKTW